MPTDSTQIEGLPAGSTVEPISGVQGLPPGSTVEPIGQSAAQSTENGQEQSQSSSGQASEDPRAQVGRGFVNAAKQTAGMIGGAGNWIEKKIGLNPPEVQAELDKGVAGLKNAPDPQTTGEKIGYGAEGLLEFMGGDAMLKGLSLAERLKMASGIADLAEKHPFYGKLIRAGLNSLRYGTTDTGEKLLHGSSLPDAIKSGAITAGAGLAAGAALPDAEATVKSAAQDVVPKAVDRTVAAANPKVGGGRFIKSVEKALPDMQRVALSADSAPKDLVGYIDLAKKTGENLESQFQQIMDPVKGAKVDTTPIADAMESNITPFIEKKYPELAESIRKEASTYRGQQMTLEELDDFRKGVNNENESFFKKNNLARSDAAKDPNVGYKVTEGDAIHDLQYDTLQKMTGEDVRSLKKTQSAVREVRENLQNNYNRLALKDAKFRGSTNIEQLYNIFNKTISSHPFQGIKELYSVLKGTTTGTLAANAAAKTAISGTATEQAGAATKEALTPKTMAGAVSAVQSSKAKPNAKISLEKAIDSYDNEDPDKEKRQDEIYQKIIEFRKAAKSMPEEERDRMNKKIAEYSNSLVKK